MDADTLASLLATIEPSAGTWDELEFDRLSASGRIDAAVACERLVRHAQALLIQALGTLAREAEAERGVERGCTEAEVSAALRWSSVAVQQRLATAGALTGRFPETLQLLEQGRIGWGQAIALVEATAGIEEAAVARAVQARVLDLMPGQSPAATRKALRRAVLAVDPDGAQDRHDFEARRRRVELCPEEDGMATLTLYTTAAIGTAIMAALTRIATPHAVDDVRSLDQRRADAMAALVLGGSGVGLEGATRPGASDVRLTRTQGPDSATRPGASDVRLTRTSDADVTGMVPRALVQVVVSLDTLLAADDAPADLRGYGPITAQQARALAYGQHSTWRRLLTAPDGTLIHADPHTYRPAVPLARHVRLRDQTCTFPGCAMPAQRCDLDHVRPYDHREPPAGGATSAENLHALCRKHHGLKTAGLWSVARDGATGTATWSAPTGRTYMTRPQPYLTAA